ncbi:MAG: hypothetical protein D6685_16215 [Bacteroidetes bacterium]|nr:MAG: hypothetical protein D6685_16215 [Bacteroidota bacterium]
MHRFVTLLLLAPLALAACDPLSIEIPEEALRARLSTNHLVLTNRASVRLRYLAGDPDFLARVDISFEDLPILEPHQTTTIPLDEVPGYGPETRFIRITWWAEDVDEAGSLRLPVR